MIHEFRSEAVETEGGRLLLFHVQRAKGFSQVRTTQAYPCDTSRRPNEKSRAEREGRPTQ